MNNFACFNIGDFETAYKKGMELFKKHTSGRSDLNKLKLAYEEVFVNILRANENSGVEVQISIEDHDDRTEVCIKDKGLRFDPFEVDSPDITLSAEERGIGGMGIFLFRQLTDYADYEYREGFNILTFGINNSQKR